MFEGFSQETSDFLWSLQFNNERTWFQEHKNEFEQYLNNPFKELAAETLILMREKYPNFSFNAHVSRIYRDARRLYGRGPYRDRLWFSIYDRLEGNGGPGFWFELSAASHAHGMGFYAAKADVMERYRSVIEVNTAAAERLAILLKTQDRFVLEGEEYKRPKKDMGELLNPWYNRKWIGIEYEDDFGGEIFSPELPNILVRDFEFLMPFYDFFKTIFY